MARSPRLAARRLVFVTGKGGVGKTTVAAALALAAAGRGLRTIVCSIAAEERLGALFGNDALDHSERPLAPGVWGIAVEPRRARDEWLHYQLPAPLAALLARSRLLDHLGTLAPGLEELLAIGKVWEVSQPERIAAGAAPYDLAIVDAPATGHGLAVLSAPHTFAQVARVGPVRRHAEHIDRFLRDPAATAVIAVTRPEELPLLETLELATRLESALGRRLDLAVVNGVVPLRLTAAEAKRLAAAELDGAARKAATLALSERRVAVRHSATAARLRRRGVPVSTLPQLPALDDDAARGQALAALARRLARVL